MSTFFYFLFDFLSRKQTNMYDNTPGGEHLGPKQCEHPREERDEGVCLGLADQDWRDRFLPV